MSRSAFIDGIVSCHSGKDGCDIWQGIIPENLPDCRIHYKDIGLEKRIDGVTASRVLLA